LANGPYTVAYRVVSVDGHTVQGSYTFTVADPDLPAAAAAPVPTAGSPAAGGVPAGVLIGLAALGTVLAAIAISLVVSGRRQADCLSPATRGRRLVHRRPLPLNPSEHIVKEGISSEKGSS
jgi:hypothetical protein